jgi:alkylation response protein AidB-like acyl-CoA dehydrogenase
MDDPRTWARRVAWERELAQQCWVGLDWPAEYGGLGASLLHQLVFEEEYAAARAPARAGFFGEHLLGPTLLVHGTESQKRRFLPRIAAGEEFWCQGYSEPGAGSDLAGVSSRAVRDGGEWVISGQKIWTSLAQFADWIFVLCRTDPDAPRHRGLSLLLCPLHQPSVEVRPIRQLTGDREFNEVFFDGARTAADMVVGAPGDGWRVAMTVLGFERGIAFLGMQRGFEREFAAVAALAGEDAHPSASIRHRVVDAWVGLQVMRAIGLRTVSAYAAGQAPGPEASIGKLYWSHWHQRLGSLAMDVGGMSSTTVDGPEELARLQRMFLFSRQDTIAAGSSEIQRTIIGERVLGLPREPT